MPKMVEALNQARKAAESENSSETKIRGGASIGLFENE